jgi:hypothetical protein
MQRYNPASVDCPGHVLLGLRMSFLEGGHWDCHVKECLVTNCVWMAISAKVATTTGLQCFLPASLCWPDLHVHKTFLPNPIPTAFTKYYVTSQRCPKQCPKNCVLGTFPTKQYFGNIHKLLKMFQFATYRVSNMSQKASQNSFLLGTLANAMFPNMSHSSHSHPKHFPCSSQGISQKPLLGHV